MFDIDFANNKALAVVFAFGASALMMAYAIIPASPAGLLA
ncbi:recombination protein F [Qipengyuania sp. GH1]|nr:recombination protein F [Qipengyuania aestuarii]MBX7535688.1 recombination protein F [Qipengyuania aestuarii]